MWKALIKLVERLAYRCEHKWEKVAETQTYNSLSATLPVAREQTYMCTKCAKHKTIKV